MKKSIFSLDSPALAKHYEETSVTRQFRVGRMLIEALGVHAGDRVLDVGCGTGLLTEYVAQLAGPQGSVRGIDVLATRIDIARSRSHATLSFDIGDVYDLGSHPPGGYDVVYLNAVFHWFAEKIRPLQQIHRVLRPGGRLGIWTGSKGHPKLTQVIRRQVLARPPYSTYAESRQGGLYRVSAAELGALLEETGFTIHKIELCPNTSIQPTADAAIAASQAATFGNFLGHLPEPLRMLAQAEIRAELERHRQPEGIHEGGAQLLAVASTR
ncbi:class I SAM-dependent methyltransferase [Xylophilus sp.]|uniref:class I SAM-dependent methyltransferase n=1 Tax=Xylophilus sp. TaxID=2653893 RepID=UPI002D80016C|nr:class I SAM-dependent methyltransferase [Xylophilus sp.]